MALGVASLITVLSVMNGFAGELRGRILALVPHAFVFYTGDRSDPTAQSLQAALLATPEVLAAAPFSQEAVLLAGPYRKQGAILFGLSPDAQASVTDLEQYLQQGSLPALKEPFSVILGGSLARMLGVFPGDKVRVVLPRLTTTPLGVFPRSRMLTVVGLFEVGAQQDSQLAYTSLTTADRLLGSAGRRGLQLRTTDLMAAPDLGPRLASVLGDQGIYRPWSDTQGSLFRAIRMEKLTVSLLLMGVVLVAAFNVVSTLVMAVSEKRRDIAVLRTMGATPAEIARVFLTQGLALALFGVCVGTVIGVVLALNVAELVDSLERMFGVRLFDPSVYLISRLPSQLQLSDVLLVSASAALLSVLAALYPAWRASRIAPAEVLRYE